MSNCSCVCRRSRLATSRSFWIVSVAISSLTAAPDKTDQMKCFKLDRPRIVTRSRRDAFSD